MPLLAEGKVYKISNVKIVPGPPNYRTVSRDLALNFYYRTKINNVEDTGIIPRFRFELKDLKDVPAYVSNVKDFIDVIGIVQTYGQLETRSNGAQKLDVLLSNGSDQVVVALWEAKATHFLKLLTDAKDEAIFAIIIGLIAKKFAGTVILSSSDATRTYFNIDYAPLKELKDKLSGAAGKNYSEISRPVAVRFVNSEDRSVQESNIKEILETTLPNGTVVLHRSCEATILAVLDGDGWYYNCCPRCAHKVNTVDEGYYCAHCEKDASDFKPRYRIIVRVEDPTGRTTFALFNKEAEDLVGVPVDRVIADIPKDTDLNVIPPAIKNIVGKKCAFEVRITSYNTDRGFEEYTVFRLSECSGGRRAPPADIMHGGPAKKPKNETQ